MSSDATYRSLLRLPGAAAFFLSAWIGRIGIAMTGLSLVWLVHQTRGSFGPAGVTTGSFALAEAAVGPQVARLVDRCGQSRIAPLQGTVHAVAIVGLCLVAFSSAPTAVLALVAGLAGATIPQSGALSAARWAFLLRNRPRPELTVAFSLESVANSLAFLTGPVVVSLLGAHRMALFSQLGACCLILVSGLLLGPQGRTDPGRREVRPAAGERPARRLRRSMVVVIAMNLAIGVFFGASQVSVTGFAVSAGRPEMAAPTILLSSCAGLVGAAGYGRLTSARPAAIRLVRVCGALAAASAVLPFVPTVVWLIPVLIVCELFVPPTLVNLNVLMEGSAPAGMLTEAFTWANSASAAGSAIAASAAGLLLDRAGPSGGFSVLVCGTVLLLALALLMRYRTGP